MNHLDPQRRVFKKTQSLLRRFLPCFIGVVAKINRTCISGEQRDLPFRKRGAQARHGIVKACLMERNYIQIPLTENQKILRSFFGVIQGKNIFAFFINQRIAGIDIFSLCIARKRSAAECKYIAAQIEHREHGAVHKRIVIILFTVFIAHAKQICLVKLQIGKAVPAHEIPQLVPSGGRIA